jgi:ribosomal-protein-alanine N-acetyltransferase
MGRGFEGNGLNHRHLHPGIPESQNRRTELGYALAQAHWGHGYMTEMLCELLQFALEMQLHRLTADTDPNNQPSLRLLERLGFRREGYFREHHFVQGEPQDSIMYGLLRSEWKGCQD